MHNAMFTMAFRDVLIINTNILLVLCKVPCHGSDFSVALMFGCIESEEGIRVLLQFSLLHMY